MKVNIFSITMFRAVIILFAAVIVSLVWFAGANSFSWFLNDATALGKVNTATSKDIIKEVTIVEENGGVKSVVITKADSAPDGSIIYPTVEGDASNYVLHMNPVKFNNKTNKYIIPVNASINAYQYAYLMPDSTITGALKIKYLNEYIDDEYPLKFTAGYLKGCLNNKKSASALSKIDESTVNNNLAELITIAAGYGKWKGVTQLRANKTTTGETNGGRVYELDFTQNQRKIIESITPGLISYIDSLLKNYRSLQEENKNKDKEIEELKKYIRSQTDASKGTTEQPKVEPGTSGGKTEQPKVEPGTSGGTAEQPKVEPGTGGGTTEQPKVEPGTSGGTTEQPKVGSGTSGGTTDPPRAETSTNGSTAQQPKTN